MKITSGDYKYRKLEIPEDIRPTTEKVREAIFSMIMNWNQDAVVADVFAGSGALGLEALSRGASKCYFNEGNRKNFKILKDNIANCRADDKSSVSNKDFRAFLGDVREQLDIVFLDPPYRAGYYDEAFGLILENDVLRDGALVVAEHLYDNELPEAYGPLSRIKSKKYGTIGVDVYMYNIAMDE